MRGAIHLLVDPHEFFASRSGEPSLVGPGLVVLANAASATTVVLLLLWSFTEVFAGLDSRAIVYVLGGQAVQAPQAFVFSAVLSFGMYFVVWVGVAGVASLVARHYDGAGSFRRVLAFVGWSFLPVLVGTAVATGVLVALLGNAPALSTSAAVREWTIQNVGEHPLYRAIRAVRPLLTVWTVYLWVLAAQYGRGLTRRQAVVAVALPGIAALGNAAATYYFLFA